MIDAPLENNIKFWNIIQIKHQSPVIQNHYFHTFAPAKFLKQKLLLDSQQGV
jgi:hypothetical protein